MMSLVVIEPQDDTWSHVVSAKRGGPQPSVQCDLNFINESETPIRATVSSVYFVNESPSCLPTRYVAPCHFASIPRHCARYFVQPSVCSCLIISLREVHSPLPVCCIRCMEQMLSNMAERVRQMRWLHDHCQLAFRPIDRSQSQPYLIRPQMNEPMDAVFFGSFAKKRIETRDCHMMSQQYNAIENITTSQLSVVSSCVV